MATTTPPAHQDVRAAIFGLGGPKAAASLLHLSYDTVKKWSAGTGMVVRTLTNVLTP